MTRLAGSLLPVGVRCLPAAHVARPRQRLVELAFEHEFEEFANPIAQPGFDWVKPVVISAVSFSDCGRQGLVLLLVMA